MTLDKAWKVIENLRGWNVEQTSCSRAFGGAREPVDDVYDARRAALKLAWETVKKGGEA